MSRAAYTYFAGAIVVTAATVWGVHYIQKAENEAMYAGVVRDAARQESKRKEREERAANLKMNQEREARFQQIQPTREYLRKQEEVLEPTLN